MEFEPKLLKDALEVGLELTGADSFTPLAPPGGAGAALPRSGTAGIVAAHPRPAARPAGAQRALPRVALARAAAGGVRATLARGGIGAVAVVANEMSPRLRDLGQRAGYEREAMRAGTL